MTDQASDEIKACVKSLPRKIKIGAYDWKVTLLDGDDGLCGQADFSVHELRLWPANLMSAGHVVGITLHECLHVIFENQKLADVKRKHKRDFEEKIVLGFEAGLVSLLRDNPRLFSWMKKWLAVKQ